LRAQTIALARPLIPELADDLRREDADPEEAAQNFVDALVDNMGRLIEGVLDAQLTYHSTVAGLNVSSTMWSYVLPLFGDTEELRRGIVRDAGLITGRTNRDVAPEAAVGQLLRSHLEASRRKMGGVSPNRQKTWEAIQGVSSEVVRTNPGTALAERCSEPHLRAVQARIAERYPDNKNYNMSLGSLQAYFDQFYADCAESAEVAIANQISALQEETGIWPRLEICLENLRMKSEDEWEALLVKHKMDDIPPERQEDYQRRKAITRHAFEKRYVKAFEFLRDCLLKAVDFQLLRGG
jgi:hypothetical protein